MTATIRKHLTRTTTAARKAARSRHVLYAALNGSTGADVLTGRATLASTVLDRLGYAPEFVRRYASPFGRKLAAAWRKLTGTEPTRVWVERDGRWLHVAAYPVGHPAIEQAIATYPRTATA